MDRREALQTIAAEARRGELGFPTSVEVALGVQRALDDPDCHVEAAARLIQTEPLLSARVVALANSVAFNRSGRPITDVRIAAARLGFRMIRALAAAVVTRQMAGISADPVHRLLAERLWAHTAHVTALAHVLSRRVTRQDPETAMFAGIVHEVGGFYLLSRAKDFPCLFDGRAAERIEDSEEQAGGGEIGRAVLTVLSVPQAVVAAIEGLWAGTLALPPASLGDTLLLADRLSPVRSPLHRPPGGDAASQDLALVVGQETLAGILEDSAEEVDSMIVALSY
ncbi:MAG TPA: HDOD domain-containing protein [Rhodocyclaceae bacterium]|nr:HDOD domain-containing protein [Rhodocyclaceae bacterium]